jgi:carbon storage regulator CsrA
MLVLSRKTNESVVVGSVNGLTRLLTVTVLDIRHGSVRLGFDADDDLPVHRSEIWDRLTGPPSRPTVPELHLPRLAATEPRHNPQSTAKTD